MQMQRWQIMQMHASTNLAYILFQLLWIPLLFFVWFMSRNVALVNRRLTLGYKVYKNKHPNHLHEPCNKQTTTQLTLLWHWTVFNVTCWLHKQLCWLEGGRKYFQVSPLFIQISVWSCWEWPHISESHDGYLNWQSSSWQSYFQTTLETFVILLFTTFLSKFSQKPYSWLRAMFLTCCAPLCRPYTNADMQMSNLSNYPIQFNSINFILSRKRSKLRKN